MSKHEIVIATPDQVVNKLYEARRIAYGLAEAGGVKVTVQTMSRRSAAANAALWAALSDISQQIDWHGIRLAPSEWKDLLSAGLTATKSVPNIDGTGFVLVGQRTSQMSVKQMGELLELVYAFGAERNVKFGAPSWMEDMQ